MMRLQSARVTLFVLSSSLFLSEALIVSAAVFFDSGQTLGSSLSEDVRLGDFDGDGDLDAFVANQGQPNRVWLNDGNGQFTDSGQLLGSGRSEDVELADLDGDGDLDAFVPNMALQGNRVYLNDGSGVFTDSGLVLGSSDSFQVGLGDLDGDGDVDAFVVNENSQPNRVLINSGSGVFSYTAQTLGAANSRGVGLADLDGDGDLDAFVANIVGGNRIWLNDGSGSFTDSGQSLGSNASVGVQLRDFDGDLDIDAFVANTGGQPNRVYVNDGSGGFSDSGQLLGATSSAGVAAGDFDGDGDLDVFIAVEGLSQPDRVWLNDGAGGFSDSGQALGAEDGRNLDVGDVDGDGDLDVVVANTSSQGNKVWFNCRQELVVEFSFQPTYISGTDDQGMNGSTWSFRSVISQSNYGGLLPDNAAAAIPGSVQLTVSGSSVPANNGTFTLMERDTTDFVIFPDLRGTILWDDTSGGVSDFTFGTVVVNFFAPEGSNVASPVPGDPILANHFDGASWGDVAFTIGAATFSMPTTPVVASSSCTPLEFGDAPDTYGTRWSANGARHAISGPVLGAIRDVENEGFATVSATGDDVAGSVDDEDGVSFVGGPAFDKNSASGELSLTISNGPADYEVWIDWNIDGDFLDAGELAAFGTLANGTHPVLVSVPASAATGNSYVRVRVYSQGTRLDSPVGAAASGEVEDYQVSIVESTLVSLLSFGVDSTNDGAVLFSWTTGSELRSAGFNILRTEVIGEVQYQSVIANDGLITAKGNEVLGASYTFTDAPGYGRFIYQLQELEQGGDIIDYGARVIELRPRLHIERSGEGIYEFRFRQLDGWSYVVESKILTGAISGEWAPVAQYQDSIGWRWFGSGGEESRAFRLQASKIEE